MTARSYGVCVWCECVCFLWCVCDTSERHQTHAGRVFPTNDIRSTYIFWSAEWHKHTRRKYSAEPTNQPASHSTHRAPNLLFYFGDLLGGIVSEVKNQVVNQLFMGSCEKVHGELREMLCDAIFSKLLKSLLNCDWFCFRLPQLRRQALYIITNNK